MDGGYRDPRVYAMKAVDDIKETLPRFLKSEEDEEDVDDGPDAVDVYLGRINELTLAQERLLRILLRSIDACMLLASSL